VVLHRTCGEASPELVPQPEQVLCVALVRRRAPGGQVGLGELIVVANNRRRSICPS
jgi:hypothetical protein